MTVTAASRRFLAWRCRRGILELDLILAVLDKRLATMNDEQLAVAKSFLAHEDPELFDLLVAETSQPKPEHRILVTELRAASATTPRLS